MDGSAADGEHSFFSALFLPLVVRRLQRASGPYQAGPSAEEGRQKDGYQEVSQEVQQEIDPESRQEGRQEDRPESRQEGRQEDRPEIVRQEVRQEICPQVGQERRAPRCQAREVSEEGLGPVVVPEAGEKGRSAALASD